MPFPDHLPATVDDLIGELDKRVRPPVVSGPESRDAMDTLIYEAGRRSLVDELIVLKKRGADG